MKFSIIIPCFNEIATIEELLRRVHESPLETKEIIVVDDFSTDGTRELLKGYQATDIKIVLHDKNQGKGAALRSGFGHASGDVIIIQDADLEYDPQDYPRLVKPILDNKADVVFGSRFMGSDAHRVLYFWHYLGNKFLTVLSNMLTNLNLTDMETGYKVFRSDIISKFSIQENRFGFEPEITAKLAKIGCRIYEVGISYSGRTYGEGKKIGWKDGIRGIYCIMKYRITN